MSFVSVAATFYCAATAFAVAFQLALAGGAPWGAYAMGGKHPGRFPPALRVAAVAQGLVLVGLALLVVGRAGWGPGSAWSSGLIWIAVGVSGVSLIMNLITPSHVERRLWAPVAFVMFASSLAVALG